MALDEKTRHHIRTLRLILDLFEERRDCSAPLDADLTRRVEGMLAAATHDDPLYYSLWLADAVRLDASVLADAKGRRRNEHGYHADGDETCTAEVLADRMIAAYPADGSFPWSGRLGPYRDELVHAIETSSFRGRGKGDGQGAGAADAAMATLLKRFGLPGQTAHARHVARGRRRRK